MINLMLQVFTSINTKSSIWQLLKKSQNSEAIFAAQRLVKSFDEISGPKEIKQKNENLLT